MRNSIYEVVKEFTMYVDGLSYQIKARISKKVTGDDDIALDYKWEISHYYRPQGGATVYRSDAIRAEDYDGAKFRLFMYMQDFTNIDLEPNPFY